MRHYAELIKDSRGAQKAEFAKAIKTLSQELLESSELMLQQYKSSHSHHSLDTKPINLYQFVEQRLQLFNPLITEKQITTRNFITEHLWSNINETSLTIVLNNLISNALKFTPEQGALTLKNHSRIIQVLDTAPAIVSHEQLKIFEAFQKATSATSHSGFGLGLHISSELIDAWGGKIWLKSYPDQGNQFSFTIPGPH